MKIGIDLDDVIVSIVSPFIDFYNKKYGKNVSFEDMKTYNFWECGIGKTRKEAIKFTDEFFNSEEFKLVPLIKGARKSIDLLSKKFQIYILTGRKKRYIETTKEFVKQNFPDIPIEVYHSGDYYIGQDKTKVEFCKELGIRIIVEDSLENAINCSKENIKVFLIDRPWNQGKTNGNIKRVQDWEDILDEILPQ